MNKLFVGNSLEILKTFEDNYIDCVVTSPPYWNLRKYDAPDGDYGDWKGQLGLEKDFNQYLDHLVNIFKEIKRVIKPTGTIWINIGDTYGRGMSGKMSPTHKFSEGANKSLDFVQSSFHVNKSLCMIPQRLAIRLIDELGLVLRNQIIWHKPNGLPSSATDRFTNNYELMYFFVKSDKYYFDMIYEPFAESTFKRVHNFIDNDEKYDPSKHKWNINSGGQPPMQILENISKTIFVSQGKHKTCIWSIPTANSHDAHFAVFPEQLAEIPISVGCPKGGIVLDPFCGSGTTGVVAKKLGRDFWGIDISSVYVKMSDKNCKKLQHKVII